ncbi:uracil phosphoribosyltransferase [Urechidicola sp. KH5]
MKVHHLGADNSVLQNFISEIRSVNIQKDQMRFRRNIERIGEILSYELSKVLPTVPSEITTPLGVKSMNVLQQNIVICSILRAGLPLHNGILSYFDQAENAFISAYRHHLDTENFEIKVEYLAAPIFTNKTLILADPMLATGRSLVSTYDALLQNGTPEKLHVLAVIGATEGIEHIEKSLPENTELWIAAIDPSLNSKGYIVPGLGDAGDLAYGSKL